jgi:hypothetical protein
MHVHKVIMYVFNTIFPWTSFLSSYLHLSGPVSQASRRRISLASRSSFLRTHLLTLIHYFCPRTMLYIFLNKFLLGYTQYTEENS